MPRSDEHKGNEYTELQLIKMKQKNCWNALLPLALEMGFDFTQSPVLNTDWRELRNLMICHYRERSALLKQCQKAYQDARKALDKQKQVVMEFHKRGLSQ